VNISEHILLHDCCVIVANGVFNVNLDGIYS